MLENTETIQMTPLSHRRAKGVANRRRWHKEKLNQIAVAMAEDMVLSVDWSKVHIDGRGGRRQDDA